MMNTPEVKLAVVGVSRDCFPIELTRTRLGKVVDACKSIGVNVYACKTVIENEVDTLAALSEAADAGANAAVLYLGNFGPEGPLSIFAQRFHGPVMACAASEETKASLAGDRGDAYCGMLNASYNFGLRGVHVYIPQMPVGLPDDVAGIDPALQPRREGGDGVRNLKIFGFGPGRRISAPAMPRSSRSMTSV